MAKGIPSSESIEDIKRITKDIRIELVNTRNLTGDMDYAVKSMGAAKDNEEAKEYVEKFDNAKIKLSFSIEKLFSIYNKLSGYGFAASEFDLGNIFEF